MICKIHALVFSADQSHFPSNDSRDCTKVAKMIIVEAPFIEELSGKAMVKILDMQEQTTDMI